MTHVLLDLDTKNSHLSNIHAFQQPLTYLSRIRTDSGRLSGQLGQVRRNFNVSRILSRRLLSGGETRVKLYK